MDPTADQQVPAAGTPDAAPSSSAIPTTAQVMASVMGGQRVPAEPVAPPAEAAQTPETPPEPSVDEAAQLRTRIAEIEAAAERDKALLRQIQEVAEQQRRQNQRAQDEQTLQQRINEAVQYAQRLDTDADGQAFMARFVAAEIAGRDQQHAQQLSAYEQEVKQAFYELTVPQYAADLAKQHHLAPELTDALMKLTDPQKIDELLPVFQLLNGKLTSTEQAVAQIAATQQANQYRASGATHVGGAGASPVSGEIKPGSRRELRPYLADALGRLGMTGS